MIHCNQTYATLKRSAQEQAEKGSRFDQRTDHKSNVQNY